MSDESANEEPTEENLKEFEGIKNQAMHHFYFLIGASITAWSKTEGYHVLIATMLLDTTPEKAGLVLYSITNFYNWLSIIGELFNLDPNYQPAAI